MPGLNNPFLKESRFGRSAWLEEVAGEHRQEMTLPGTVIASATLFIVCAISAIASWGAVTQWGLPGFGLFFGAMILATIAGIGVNFFPAQARWMGWIYAASEGVVLGTISHLYQLGTIRAGGGAISGNALIADAVILTFGVFGAMLVAYATGLLRASALVVRIAIVGVMAICGVSFLASILWFFHEPGLGQAIWGSGPLGIAFSVICVGVASTYLLLNFDTISRGVEARSPKYMEWVAAVGLLVTVVWLYLEILRLLAKLNSRRD